MHYLNLQEGKKKARRVALIFEAYNHECGGSYVGSRYEKTLIRTRVPCSCERCGNPRRHRKGADRLTIADKRQNDMARDQIASAQG